MKIGRFFMALFAVLIGLYPIIYFVIDRKFGLLSTKSEELLSDAFWNVSFYGHIILGGVALLIGWIQFMPKWRKRNIRLHRSVGKVYLVSVLISGVCGLVIALSASGGTLAKVGFFTPAVLWLLTTTLAFVAIRKGDVSRHQKMMILSYAICFSAVTLRIWLPLLTVYFGEFIPAYRVVAWVSWVPNLVVAYFITRTRAGGHIPRVQGS